MDELGEYDGATLEKAIHALDDEELISLINKIAEKNNCRISICHHKDEQKKDIIYFCAELIDDNVKTTNTLEISARIYELTHYYEKIFVNFKSANTQSTFEDVTLFTPENYDNIHVFFQKHYPECYQGLSKAVIAHQDKRQRSISPPPRGPSFFPQNGGHQQDESDTPYTAEMLVKYLQQDPHVWEGIRRSPGILDDACGRAKRVLSEEKGIDPRPTGAAK